MASNALDFGFDRVLFLPPVMPHDPRDTRALISNGPRRLGRMRAVYSLPSRSAMSLSPDTPDVATERTALLAACDVASDSTCSRQLDGSSLRTTPISPCSPPCAAPFPECGHNIGRTTAERVDRSRSFGDEEFESRGMRCDIETSVDSAFVLMTALTPPSSNITIATVQLVEVCVA